jgi:uncharacterized protein YecA (UPF0149 family)
MEDYKNEVLPVLGSADNTTETDEVVMNAQEAVADAKANDVIVGGGAIPPVYMTRQKTKPHIKDFKVGRNDPCPCGSGEKYKKCCMASGKYETYHTA